ncbi:acyltransferase family protein [Kitasatospora sp. NBC_01539]|uniref:acyltransferase family protein n=1 Tax=Kitasatospora sp. NBC_01539 TaxID=2903577 RepID=UPI003860109F
MSSGRDRYVDLLRALAICLVVSGHWLITVLAHRDGALVAPELLATLPWTRWLTLLFQIMPVFFLAGGYAAAGSWDRHRAAGGTAARWVRQRAVRLLLPTAAYAALALAGLALARTAGADPGLLGMVGWALAMQFWFLPVYLLITALTPLLAAAHRRWGAAVPAVLAAAAAAVGPTPLRDLDHLLVWAVAYQLGLCWRDGLLVRRTVLAALAAGGAAAFALLVAYGPYPVSLILVTGEEVSNTDPPSAAMLAWAVAQCAVCLLLAPAAGRALRPARARRAARATAAASMALYLWHMVPVLVLAAALYLPGLAPEPAVGSGGFWALRAVWIAALAAVLVAVLRALRPLDRVLRRLHAVARTEAEPRSPLPLVLGYAAVVPALAYWAGHGFAHGGVLPGLAFAAGTALVLLPPAAMPAGQASAESAEAVA